MRLLKLDAGIFNMDQVVLIEDHTNIGDFAADLLRPMSDEDRQRLIAPSSVSGYIEAVFTPIDATTPPLKVRFENASAMGLWFWSALNARNLTEAYLDESEAEDKPPYGGVVNSTMRLVKVRNRIVNMGQAIHIEDCPVDDDPASGFVEIAFMAVTNPPSDMKVRFEGEEAKWFRTWITRHCNSLTSIDLVTIPYKDWTKVP